MTAAPKKRSAPKPKKTPAKKSPAKQAQQIPASLADARRLRTWVHRGAYLCGACALVLFLVTLVWAGSLRFVNPPFTALMMMRHLGEEHPIDKVWRNYDEVSPHLLLAVLAAEDQRFYTHRGFDLKEIRNAIEERSNGGRVRGASTLSQQTAKNVFLWPTRSWWRKGAEAYFTVLIEALWSKRRILEVYVNVAEMGPGIYGVESAARRYFNTSASELTAQEAALIASILPSPLTRDPSHPTDSMRLRQTWILTQMNNLGGVPYLERQHRAEN